MYNPIIAPIAVIIPEIIAALYPKEGIEKTAEDIFPPIKINAIARIINTK